jgi:hypothetical protein
MESDDACVVGGGTDVGCVDGAESVVRSTGRADVDAVDAVDAAVEEGVLPTEASAAACVDINPGNEVRQRGHTPLPPQLPQARMPPFGISHWPVPRHTQQRRLSRQPVHAGGRRGGTVTIEAFVFGSSRPIGRSDPLTSERQRRRNRCSFVRCDHRQR